MGDRQPYYEDDYVTIYHGDCLELADLWVGGDVMVTDPPYGIRWKQRKGGFGLGKQEVIADAVAGDDSPEVRDAALSLWGDRPAIVFGSWRIPRPDNTRNLLVWWKQGQKPGPANTSWLSQHEEIYILGGGFRRTSPPARSVLVTTEDRSSFVGKVGHPTPKPLDLMMRLIDRCPPGVIVDPFMGSGSTLRAAKDLGRRAIGIELEERYCEIAAKRCAQEVLAL